MNKKFKKSLFIFRRDLRLEDNTALLNALKNSDTVIPAFIFDNRQVGKENEYRSLNAIQFMIESLQDLDDCLKNRGSKLYVFEGDPVKIVKGLIQQKNIDAVFVNKDYTPFSKKRDQEIKDVCQKHNVEFISEDDLMLNPPEKIMNKSGEPYSVFTPYFKTASKEKVKEPEKNNFSNFYTVELSSTKKLSQILKKLVPNLNSSLWVNGGRSNGLKLLRKIENLKNYEEIRDYPEYETSNLSAHNKFGTISIREFYYAIKKYLSGSSKLILQLYWRDFFTMVAYFNPRVFGKPFYSKYNDIKWSRSKKNLEAWQEGKTGFPIVDAGMRQLNKTGYMHNRLRMIVASFLTKDLHINWLDGEKYFAQKLVDYDPCVNNGSWQWAASTGCDATPYFRIFNPWSQQKRFDPECVYIKEWVPELKKLTPKEIHNLHKDDNNRPKDYPAPMVDHKKQAEKAKEIYKQAAKD